MDMVNKLNVASMIDVLNPYDGSLIGSVEQTMATDLPKILAKAKQGKKTCHDLPRYRRAEIIETAARKIEEDADDFAMLIVREAGKTIKQAEKEVKRCVNTMRLSAEEAKRNAGEVIPFDSYEGSESRQGWFSREPLGIILAITPFNDPLNLVAHKIGPAIAGGNSVILKPSELTPLSAVKLVSYLVEAGLPEEVITIAVGDASLGQALVAARDIRMVSFTGGFVTGENIARNAGLKKLAMDLGGNAAVIVANDCDIDQAVEACVSGAFWAAGQNCIGTQRILIDSLVYDIFKEKFVQQSEKLITGNPALAETDIGPMISEKSAKQAEHLVFEAIKNGANLLCGHKRKGACYSATVLEGVNHTSSIWCAEAFSPIVILEPFDSMENAIELANRPEYSLHAGIFTSNLNTALDAAQKIEAGGVMINDSSDYRFDAMPFGGFKYGSMGREGVSFAYEDMTQPKVVCINR